MATSGSVTVVVIGDLATPPDACVLARVDDPRRAPRLVDDIRPQVVLAGLGRDRNAVLAVLSELTTRVPGAPVLAVSGPGSTDPAADVLAAVRAGARGYLVKGAEQDEIVRAISAVAAGGVVFGASLARRIAEFFAAGPAAPTDAFPQLTSREREILDLVAPGRPASAPESSGAA
jgi:DNA-binding NarL/FixJ family response regulator